MSIMKRRLAVLLVACLAFTSAFLFLPQKQSQVEAASVKSVKILFEDLTHYDDKGEYKEDASIVVIKGAKNLYMGDFASAKIAYAKGYSIRPLSYTSNISYKSNNPAVLSVDKKTGKAVAKKTGKAKVTYQYKKGGKTVKKSLVVTVVKSGIYRNNKLTKKSMDSAYAKIKKYVGKKITTSNRYEVAKALEKYNNTADINADGDYYYGYCIRCGLSYLKKGFLDVYSYKMSNIVLEPKMMRGYAFAKYAEAYQKELNPFSTYCAKMYSVVKADSSFKANTKTGTVTINRKVTDNDLFAARVYQHKFTKASNAVRIVYVMDPSDMTIVYEATLTMKKNSNKMDLKVVEGSQIYLNTPDNGEPAFVDVREVSIDDFAFVQGKKYYLLDTYNFSDDYENLSYLLVKEKTWTKNVKLTAK